MLIDAHAHLDRYGDDLNGALSEIESRSILTISVSMDVFSWERNREIAAHSRLVVPAFGIHPWNALEYIDRLDEIAAAASGAAMLGEIGLDHYFAEDASAYPAQQQVFEFFLSVAAEQNTIVNLHTKGAESMVLGLLGASGAERAIVHWYSGPLAPLREFIERGVFLTVGVEVLHSERARRIAREIPDDLLLTETDNPGGIEWLTGTPGRPAVIEDVVATVADVRETTPADIVHTVERNVLRLIDGDPRLSSALKALGGEPRSRKAAAPEGGAENGDRPPRATEVTHREHRDS